MPILEVEIVLREGEVLSSGLARQMADLTGAVFGSAPAGTWVRLRTLQPHNYAENDSDPSVELSPVFVTVLKRSLPPLAARRTEAARLAAAVAAACGRPAENVHILYLPPAAGRIAFGGKL